MSFQDLKEWPLSHVLSNHVVASGVTQGGIDGQTQVVHDVRVSQLVQDFNLLDEVLDCFLGQLAFAEALDGDLGTFPDASKDVAIATACQEITL